MAGLVSAIILAVSQVTLNSILGDVVTSLSNSSYAYTAPNQFFEYSNGMMRSSLAVLMKNISVSYLNITDYSIALDPASDIILTFHNISTHFTFNWEYTMAGLTDTGNASITMTSASIVSDILVADSLLFSLSARNVQVSIGDLTISVFKPNDASANWLFSTFQADIKSAMSSLLQSLMTNIINSASLGSMFINVTGDELIGFNYSLAEVPYMTVDMFQVESIGTFVENSNPVYDPPIPKPSIATINDVEGVQVVISDFTANSLSYAAYSAGLLDVNITNSELPANFPIQLSTTVVGLFVPGLIDTYGVGHDMSVYCSFDDAPEIVFKDSLAWTIQSSLSGSISCSVYVDTTLALLIGTDIYGDGEFYLESWRLKGTINNLYISNFKVISSTFTFNSANLVSTINSALSGYIDSINSDYLEKGIELPANTRADLNNSMAKSGAGYVYLLINPTVSFTIDKLFNYLG